MIDSLLEMSEGQVNSLVASILALANSFTTIFIIFMLIFFVTMSVLKAFKNRK